LPHGTEPSPAAQLEIHAKQELDHALIPLAADRLSRQNSSSHSQAGTISKNPKDMLRYDLDNENETIRNYRDRIRQCETVGEYTTAKQIRQILHAGAGPSNRFSHCLGEAVPDPSGGPKGRTLRKRR
jgi:bacterioferritin